eukprot:1304082-Lingulodinium_polyedra.AAC.1
MKAAPEVLNRLRRQAPDRNGRARRCPPASGRPGKGSDDHVIGEVLSPRTINPPVVASVALDRDKVNGAAGPRAPVGVLLDVKERQ